MATQIKDLTPTQMLERIEQRWNELQDRDCTKGDFACLMSDLSNYNWEQRRKLKADAALSG